jgi:isoquinoline 1-oxidoreductase subunit alpha
MPLAVRTRGMALSWQRRGGSASLGAMTRMIVNGEPLDYKLDPETPLLWALRDASNLTGTKYGCDSGECGACTVMIDGRAATSCNAPIRTLEGAQVTTIEGLSRDRSHPVQQAWLAEQVTMCGYCEPGFIMAIAAMLQASPSPSEEQIAALPNICRCGAYPRIRKAIARAAQTTAAAPPPAPAPQR